MTGYNFTDEVRRALQAARERAAERGSEQVTPAHLFLGVTSRPGPVCTAMLTDLGADPSTISDRIAATLPRAANRASPAPLDLPYTRSAKQILEAAMSEARELGHGYVGAEHLLLAFLTSRSPLATTLEQAGLTLPQARIALLAHAPGGTAVPARERIETPSVPRADAVARAVAFVALGVALAALAAALAK